MCKSWSALPEAGAMLDQDYNLIVKMQTLLNVYDSVDAFLGAKGKNIHNLSRGTQRTLKALQEMDIKFWGLNG